MAAASHIDDLYGTADDDSTPVGKLYKGASADTPGGTAPVGHSAQSSGIADINGAFGGNAAAANESLAIQQYYRDHPNVTGSQIAQQQEALANQANAVYNPDEWYDKLASSLAMAASVAGVGLLSGGALAPALASAAGVTGAAAGGGGLAGSIGSGLGSYLAAAGAGAAGGAFDSALQGQNVGIGALEGGVGAGLGAAAKPLTSALTGSGLSPTLSGALVKGGIGATTGALGAGLTGGNVGQSALTGGLTGAVTGALRGSGLLTGNSPLTNALSGVGASALTGGVRGALNGQGAALGAAGGALSGATGAVSNSIFGSGNTVFNSGSTAVQTQDPNLTNPGTSAMVNPSTNDDYDPTQDGSGAPFGFDPINTGGQYLGTPVDTGVTGGVGNIDYGSLLGQLQSNPALGDANNPLNFQSGGAGSSGSPSGSSGNLLGSLASLLGGGAGGANSGLLAQLLGLGSSAIGGSLQSSAAKGAANTFAGQTAYSPYSVTGNNGTTSFNGTNVSSSLSPGQQQTSSALTGLGQNSIDALNGGTAGAAQGYYNNLQASQADANNKFYQNNLDNQFANGVLSSTAGQYQSQAALGAIGNQQLNDQTLANNFANTQQQNQLANLTASLNGNNQINNGQLAQQSLGGQLGSQASSANLGAYSPSLAANSGSNIGNLLSTLGQTQNAGSANQNALLQYLTQNGH